MNKSVFIFIFLAIGIPIFSFYLPAILLHSLDYKKFREYNDELVQSTCKVIESNISATICYEPCYCIFICNSTDQSSTSDLCRKVCQQCPAVCFTASKTISFAIEKSDTAALITEILKENYKTIALANHSLYSTRPVGIEYKCFYKKSDYYNIWEQPIAAFHVPDLSIVFYVLGTTFAIVFGLLAIVKYRKSE